MTPDVPRQFKLAAHAGEPSPRAGARDGESRNLESRLAELTARCGHLEAARAAAEKSATAAKRLVTILHGEIRQPLDDVSRLLQSLGEANLNAERTRLVRTADSSLTAMLSLLDAMAEAGADTDQEADATSFDLRATVHHAVSVLTPLAAGRGLDLQCEVDPRIPNTVLGDQSLIHSILLFITNQALRHAVKGVVAVRVSAQPQTERTTVQFNVQSDGDGLTCELLDRILQRTALVDGIDEGLAAAFGIYERLAVRVGGDLRVEMVGVRGFRIWFSAALADPAGSGDERRGAHRRCQDMLACSLGDVADLSIGGMRIMTHRRVRGRVRLQVFDWQTTVEFEAEVVWRRRLGFRRHELGLRFINLSPEQARHLNRIWLHHSLRRIHLNNDTARGAA